MARNDPLRNFRYRLEIDQVTQANFSEVAIGETVTDPVEYREGTEPSHVRKLTGLTKYGNITLKWGVTNSTELYDWHKKIVAGQVQSNRKAVKIIVMDEAGVDQASFLVSEAWPTKYDPSDLNGKGNEVFIEVLELVNEGIERTR
ncbi:MAG: phage tail protein [Alphaproteobacteria bacterium]|nr:phage tail protein [Alphaproteobacteria bacterium]